MEVQEALVDIVASHQFHEDPEELLLGVRFGNPDFCEGPAKAGQVLADVDDPTVEHAHSFVDGVGEEQAPVHDRDAGFILGDELAVQAHDAGHGVLSQGEGRPRRWLVRTRSVIGGTLVPAGCRPKGSVPGVVHGRLLLGHEGP